MQQLHPCVHLDCALHHVATPLIQARVSSWWEKRPRLGMIVALQPDGAAAAFLRVAFLSRRFTKVCVSVTSRDDFYSPWAICQRRSSTRGRRPSQCRIRLDVPARGACWQVSGCSPRGNGPSVAPYRKPFPRHGFLNSGSHSAEFFDSGGDVAACVVLRAPRHRLRTRGIRNSMGASLLCGGQPFAASLAWGRQIRLTKVNKGEFEAVESFDQDL